MVGLALSLLGAGFVRGQVGGPSSFQVELFKPEFEQAGFRFVTSSVFLTVQETVDRGVKVYGQVPLGYVRREGRQQDEWEFRVGNPYIGLLWTSSENPATLGFGLRAPILPDDAQARSLRVADMHRFEAFTPDLWTFSIHSIVGADQDPAQAKSDLNFWIPLHSAMEVVANYSLTLRYPVVNLLAGVELRGRAALSGDDLVFGQRTRHEAGATFGFLTRGVRPSIHIRTPVQGREVVEWVFGISMVFV